VTGIGVDSLNGNFWTYNVILTTTDGGTTWTDRSPETCRGFACWMQRQQLSSEAI
jgi:photosystem II stability/assembly factor-like uncharacterized protein